MLRDPKLHPELYAFFQQNGVCHLEPGVIISESLNFSITIEDADNFASSPYGVCDSLAQLKRTDVWKEIVTDERPMAVILVPIRKSNQNERGWRWEKWGDYIGQQQPMCDYLYDEPTIELVYRFETVVLLPDGTVEDQIVDHEARWAWPRCQNEADFGIGLSLSQNAPVEIFPFVTYLHHEVIIRHLDGESQDIELTPDEADEFADRVKAAAALARKKLRERSEITSV